MLASTKLRSQLYRVWRALHREGGLIRGLVCIPPVLEAAPLGAARGPVVAANGLLQATYLAAGKLPTQGHIAVWTLLAHAAIQPGSLASGRRRRRRCFVGFEGQRREEIFSASV